MYTITYYAGNNSPSAGDVLDRIREYIPQAACRIYVNQDNSNAFDIEFTNELRIDTLKLLDSAMTSLGFTRLQPFIT